VLTGFLKERIGQMIGQEIEGVQDSTAQPEDQEPFDEPVEAAAPVEQPEHAEHARPRIQHKMPPISDHEFSTFANVELNLLDNRDYFRAIFG
jgi:hypothetical protein